MSRPESGVHRLTLPLWVHDAAANQHTSTSASTSTSTVVQSPGSSSTREQPRRYGVPLSTHLSSEVVLSRELGKAEGLHLQEGDLVEVCKGGGSQSTAPSAGYNIGSTLIFKVEKGCWAPEGSSGQLRVSQKGKKMSKTDAWRNTSQISISDNLAKAVGLKNRDHIVLSKVLALEQRHCRHV